jgi:hypothetical protein
MKALLANCLWLLSCLPEALAFRGSRSAVRGTQLRVLRSILRNNRDSDFGRTHGFARIRCVRDYRERVPARGWEGFAAQVRRISEGGSAVLTEEPVLLLEPTGGSTDAAKLVPYTRALRREFDRGIKAWVFHLFAWKPRCLSGSIYFSITPFGAARGRTPSGIPIGFEDDRDYLTGLARRFSESALAAPRELARIRDPDSFRYVTLLFLLKRADLAVISIWNPTFFMLLMKPLERLASSLIRDIRTGRIGGTIDLEPRLRAALERKLGRSPRRAAELSRILGRGLRPEAAYAGIWPRLRIISCWADANAAAPAADLARMFPRAAIQPKGLLSTEGFVSLPLGTRYGAALGIRGHFYEFLKGETPVLAHELERGARYEVVLTTGGGLYRYRTRDQVEAVGRWGGIPLVRFTGRTDAVSDMFGEKLSEEHVRSAVEAGLSLHGIRPSFWVVSPERPGADGFYTLFLEAADARAAGILRAAEEIELRLRDNPQYAYCIRLGQLRPLRPFLIDEAAAEAFLGYCVQRGQRLGGVKPAALLMTPMDKVFKGRYL